MVKGPRKEGSVGVFRGAGSTRLGGRVLLEIPGGVLQKRGAGAERPGVCLGGFWGREAPLP